METFPKDPFKMVVALYRVWVMEGLGYLFLEMGYWITTGGEVFSEVGGVSSLSWWP